MYWIGWLTALAWAEEATEDSNVDSLRRRSEEIYIERCAICHGEQGAGDGPTAMAMKPKPSDFTQPDYWANRTDAYVIQLIKFGAPEVFMPSFPKIPDAQLDDLLSYLKDFQASPVLQAEE